MKGRIGWFVIVWLIAAPAALFAQRPESPGVCTEDNPGARQRLESVLTDPDLADVLAGAGLEGATPADAVVLTGPKKAAACARLMQQIPRPYEVRGAHAAWVPTFFRLGDRYVVTVVLRDGVDLSRPMPAWGQTIILTLDFEVVETILN